MDDLDQYQVRRRAEEKRRKGHGNRQERHVRRPGGAWKRFLLRLGIYSLVLFLLAAIAGGAVFYLVTEKYRKWAEEFNLEDINNLDHPGLILDRNGREIGRIYDENRSYVPYNKISRAMIDALVAQEDKTFWHHNGYDLMGILRASIEAAKARGKANQGASTITQQLARNAYDLERRTEARGGSRIERKIVEIFLARRIEEKYSKKQILEFYLNRICFGLGYYGIRSASLGYFGKEPADLTVREAASLAALIKNPENYNPIKNPELNRKWRNDVIDRMQRQNYMSAEEAERIKKLPLELNPKPLRRNTSFLNALIQEQATDIFKNRERGEEILKSRGVCIHTTIDADMQAAAEQKLEETLRGIEERKDYDHVKMSDTTDPRCSRHRYLDGTVFAVENATGATLAYVGGRNFSRDNYNILEVGARPVGTALLPFLYLSALENGKGPCYRLVDDAMDNRLAGIGGSEGILGEWGMEQSRGRYMDSVTLRDALVWSKIAASARLGIELCSSPTKGSKPFIDTLNRVCITPPPRNPNSTEATPQYYPRVYLGTEPTNFKQLVMAYTIFPNAGKRAAQPYIITKITEHNGDTLWENPRATASRKLPIRSCSPCNAYRIHSMLTESLKRGSAQRVAPFLPQSFKGAVKTGTNYDFADNVLVGYTSDITCGVWIGFLNDHTPIYPEAFAGDTCPPILGAVLHAAEGKFKDETIPLPSDTEEVEICRYSGQLATNFCFEVSRDNKPGTRPTYREYFPKGDVTLSTCSVHGDGSPSLMDFLDSGENGSLTSARVLPVVPILPQAVPLVGEDPYGCDLTFKPRYRTKEDLAQMAAATPNAVLAEEDSETADEGPAVDCSIDLIPPGQMRHTPILPLTIPSNL